MCIEVTNEHPEPTGAGYKLFTLDGRFMVGNNFRHDVKHRPTEKWLHEYEFRFQDTPPFAYDFGWHVYETIEDARAYTNDRDHILWQKGHLECIRRVRYRGAFVEGTQKFEAFPTVVAKEILILPGEVK